MKTKTIKSILISLTIIIIMGVLVAINYRDENGNRLNVVSKVIVLLTGSEVNEPGRHKYNFNYDWTFSKGQGVMNSGSDYGYYCLKSDLSICIDSLSSMDDSYSLITNVSYLPVTDNPYLTNYNTDDWSSVSLPHTYNDVDTFDNYIESVYNGERTMYSGNAWYKKKFTIPSEYDGKRIIIEFEGARQEAIVYVNGVKVVTTYTYTNNSGTQVTENEVYENGFIPFGYDITDYITYGTENDITVYVDNTFPYIIDGTSNDTITWHDPHWHPNYGGLYRNVNMYVLDNLHLTLPLYSFTKGLGTYVYTSDETSNSAVIHVDAEIENNSDASKTFTIKTFIRDVDNNTVLSFSKNNEVLEAGTKEVFTFSGTLNNPIRWSIQYPYLYSVVTEIWQNGVLIDNNVETLGIRTFRMTNDSGFYLNENYEELNGWGQKATNEWAGLGAAYPDWMTDYVIKLMKDANGNYIRWGHVAGSPSQIEACDKYGIIVTQPAVDGEGEEANSTYSTSSYLIRIETMRDMIIYYRNHPSIVLWELGNQSSGLQRTLTANQVASVAGSTLTGSQSIVKMLSNMITTYDYGNQGSTIKNSGSYSETQDASERLVTIRHGNSTTDPYVDVGETTQLGNGMNVDTYSYKPDVEAEDNRYEARRGVWDLSTSPGFTGITTYSDYRNYTSENFATSQIVRHYNLIKGTNNMGGANWIFSDSISHGRLRSETARASGEIDGVMLEKEAYWVDQLIFGSESGLHIIGHWNYTAGTTKNVYVAGNNVSKVTLTVHDDESSSDTVYGPVSATSENLYTFNNVVYQAGSVTATALSLDETSSQITDVINTHGIIDHLDITSVVSPDGLKANGSDVIILDVEAKDANGNRTENYDGVSNHRILKFEINNVDNGKTTAVWRGGYNSGIEKSTNKEVLYLEAGIQRVSLRTTMNPGNFTVSVSLIDDETSAIDESVTPTSITITSSSVNNSNGLSVGEETRLTYVLDESKKVEYGTNSDSGATGGITPSKKESVYIANFSYLGTQNSNNKIADALGNTSLLYSDSGDTFSSIPYEFINSEYLLLPNADNGAVDVDQITFTARRNISVFLLRDDNVTLPGWVSSKGFVLTDYIIKGSNNVDYKVYRLNMNEGDSLVVGSNSENGSDGLLGVNNIFIFKETTAFENKVFFKETFDDFNIQTYLNSYNAKFTQPDSVSTETIANHDAMHFTDTTSNSIFIQKQVSPITNQAIISFDVYFNSSSSNQWNRFWINNGLQSSYSDSSKTLIESYYYLYNGKMAFKYVNSSGTQTNNYSLFTPNAWHNVKYDINIVNHTYDLYVDDVKKLSNLTFSDTSIDSIKSIAIGTGINYASDYYVDNLEIEPIYESGAQSLIVNDTTITLEDGKSTYLYASENITIDNTVVTIGNSNEYYQSLSYEKYDSDTIKVSVTNIQNNITYYYIDFTQLTILDGWSKYESTNTSIKAELMSGEQVIHIKDLNSTEMSYMQKQFDSINTKLRFSYDVYLNDAPAEQARNTYMRFILTNGTMTYAETTSTKGVTKVGVHTYLSDANANNSLKFIGRTMPEKTEINLSIGSISIKTWHHFDYIVDVENQKYSVTMDNSPLDNTSSCYNISFYKPNTSLNNIQIGSGGTANNDYFVKNIEIEELTSNPLLGISVNNFSVNGFNNNSLNYTVSLANPIDENTIVSITPNGNYYSSHTASIDVENQTITITVVNNIGESVIYTVSVENILTDEVTYDTLNDYLNVIQNEYQEDNYTSETWTVFYNAKQRAIAILSNQESTSENYENALRDIISAINNLEILITDTYTSSFADTIKVSNSLSGKYSFNKALDNDKIAYYNNNDRKFYSVPYKLLNSEYILIDNSQTIKNGYIEFVSLYDLDLLIMVDRRGGVVNDSTFTDTNDVVTVKDGTSDIIYHVYKKSYNAESTIRISVNNLIINRATGNNSIIAFIPTASNSDDIFFKDTMQAYASETELHKAYDIHESEGSSVMLGYDLLDETSSTRVLHLFSNSAGTNTTALDHTAYVYKEFAKVGEGLIYKFKVFFNNSDANVTSNKDKINNYNRAYLLNRAPLQNNDDYSNLYSYGVTPSDYYLDNNTDQTPRIFHRTNPSSTRSLVKLFQDATTSWNEVVIHYNFINNKLYFEGATDKCTESTPCSFGTNFDFLNYIYFASRAQGSTSMFYKDIEIIPVLSNIYQNIQINNQNISNYHDLTKDYVYKIDPTSTTRNASVVLPDTVTNSVTTNISDQNTYSEITGTNTNYSRDYRIFYETNANKTTLSYDVMSAYNLDSSLYTNSSYSNLTTALNNSNLVLNDLEIIQSDVDASDTALRLALTNLVSASEIALEKSEKIISGKVFNNTFENTTPYITSDSSVTLYYGFTKDHETQDQFLTTNQTRKLVSSTVLKAKTKLTLYDMDNNKIYTYIVSSSDELNSKMEFNLNTFKLSGTTNKMYNPISYYDEPNDLIKSNYIIIIDFADSTTKLSSGEYTMKLIDIISSGTTIYESNLLSYNIINSPYDLVLNSGLTSEYTRQFQPINYSINAVFNSLDNTHDYINTKYLNKKLGISFSLYQNDTLINFPSGTYITYNNVNYDVLTNGEIRFKLSDSITTLTSNLTINGGINGFDLGTYSIKMKLFISSDGINYGDIIATNDDVLIINEPLECSLKLTTTDDSQLLKNGLDNTVNLNLKSITQDEDATRKVTLALYKKSDSILGHSEYELVDINLYTNNNLTETSTTNVFEYTTFTTNLATAITTNTTISLNFKSILPKGSYKIITGIESDNISGFDEINIVVY